MSFGPVLKELSELMDAFGDAEPRELEAAADELKSLNRMAARAFMHLCESIDEDVAREFGRNLKRPGRPPYKNEQYARARLAHAAGLLPRARALAAAAAKITADFARDSSAGAIGVSVGLLREYAALNAKLLAEAKAVARAAGASLLAVSRESWNRPPNGRFQRFVRRLLTPIEVFVADLYEIGSDEARAILAGAELLAANDEEAAVFFVGGAAADADADADAADADADAADADADADAGADTHLLESYPSSDAAAASSSSPAPAACRVAVGAAATTVRRRALRAISV